MGTRLENKSRGEKDMHKFLLDTGMSFSIALKFLLKMKPNLIKSVFILCFVRDFHTTAAYTVWKTESWSIMTGFILLCLSDII